MFIQYPWVWWIQNNWDLQVVYLLEKYCETQNLRASRMVLCRDEVGQCFWSENILTRVEHFLVLENLMSSRHGYANCF